MTMPHKVYVVMGNDYPDAVFADRRMADSYVEAKMADPGNRFDQSKHSACRIYFRHYEFEVSACVCMQPGGDPMGNCEICDPPATGHGGSADR